MKKIRNITSLVTVLVMLFALLIPALAVSTPPGNWQTSSAGMVRAVWLRGSSPNNNAAIASGPQWPAGGTNGSWWHEVFGTGTGGSTLNNPFQIPAWEDFFTLNPGWELNYVVDHAGNRLQPGQNILLQGGNNNPTTSTVGSMNFNFRRIDYTLTVETALQNTPGNYTVRHSATQNTGVGLVRNISPNTSGFDTANYSYTFVRWDVISGTGTIANRFTQNTTHTSGADNATVRAVFTREMIPPPPPTTFTVTYDANFGTNPTFAAGTYEEGSDHKVLGFDAAFPTLNNDGYDFIGWSTVRGGSVMHQADDEITVNADVTLYAVWEATGPVDVLEVNTVSITLVAADSSTLRGEPGAVFNNSINLRVSVNGEQLTRTTGLIDNRRFSVDGEEFWVGASTMGNRLYEDGSVYNNAGPLGEARLRILNNGIHQWETHNYVNAESIRVIRVSDGTDVTSAFVQVPLSTPRCTAVAAEENTLFIRPGFLRLNFDPYAVTNITPGFTLDALRGTPAIVNGQQIRIPVANVTVFAEIELRNGATQTVSSDLQRSFNHYLLTNAEKTFELPWSIGDQSGTVTLFVETASVEGIENFIMGVNIVGYTVNR